VGLPDASIGFISTLSLWGDPLYDGSFSMKTPAMLVGLLSHSFPSSRNCFRVRSSFSSDSFSP